jgi:hypothetical protein
MYRHEIVNGADDLSCVGIELGVAKGIFSKRMIDSGKFSSYYGVDLYGDIHDINEYKETLKYVGLSNNYKLLLACPLMMLLIYLMMSFLISFI